MTEIKKLAQLFQKFPGIGPRQAERFVYFLLRTNPGYIQDLTDNINNLKRNIKQCQSSYQFFYSDDPAIQLSPIARDPSRDKTTIMVVEKDMDLDNIERTGAYKGQYFVLGGLVPITNGREHNYARVEQLIDRVSREHDTLSEIIFALALHPEGEHTRYHLIEQLTPIIEGSTIRLSTLGRGLSTGAELEYVDRDTFEQALRRRT